MKENIILAELRMISSLLSPCLIFDYVLQQLDTVSQHGVDGVREVIQGSTIFLMLCVLSSKSVSRMIHGTLPSGYAVARYQNADFLRVCPGHGSCSRRPCCNQENRTGAYSLFSTVPASNAY